MRISKDFLKDLGRASVMTGIITAEYWLFTYLIIKLPEAVESIKDWLMVKFQKSE